MADPNANPPPQPNPPDNSAISGATWMQIVGAVIGALTLGVFLYLGIKSSQGTARFDCATFSFMTAAFAIGAAMSAVFLGGGAAAAGNLGEYFKEHPLKVSLTGGAAMLVIMFGVFYVLKPDDCNNRTTHLELHFVEIPETYSTQIGQAFWAKQLEVHDKRILQLRVENIVDTGRIGIKRGPDEVCFLYLHVNDGFPDQNEEDHFFERMQPLQPLTFTYVLRNDAAVLETVDDCFGRKNNLVTNQIEISLKDRMLRYRKPVLPTRDAFEEEEFGYLGAIRDSSQTRTARADTPLWGAAWAQSIGKTYDGLRQSLKSPNDTERAAARQFLGENFQSYAPEALADLNANARNEPELAASILSGLIQGIETSNPALAPGSGRLLSEELPYIAGQEKAIFALTGHPSDMVRKQARRLMQRYPMDGFLPAVQDLVSEQYQVCTDDKSAWMLYASAFYYYNRIVQQGLNAPLSSADVTAIDAQVSRIKSASDHCVPAQVRVNVAVLDYGRALVYGWFAETKDDAKKAKQSFVDWVDGAESSYYYQTHVKRISAM